MAGEHPAEHVEIDVRGDRLGLPVEDDLEARGLHPPEGVGNDRSKIRLPLARSELLRQDPSHCASQHHAGETST